MKSFFLIMTVTIECILMTACTTDIDKQCNKLADAMDADHVEEVVAITNHIYAEKDRCTATNLAALSLAYNYLVCQSNNNKVKYESAKKVIECYKAAMNKDADVTLKHYESVHVDMTSYTRQYKQMLPMFKAAIDSVEITAQGKQ